MSRKGVSVGIYFIGRLLIHHSFKRTFSTVCNKRLTPTLLLSCRILTGRPSARTTECNNRRLLLLSLSFLHTHTYIYKQSAATMCRFKQKVPISAYFLFEKGSCAYQTCHHTHLGTQRLLAFAHFPKRTYTAHTQVSMQSYEHIPLVEQTTKTTKTTNCPEFHPRSIRR